MFDKEFFSFCVNVISFFQKGGLVIENAQYLIFATSSNIPLDRENEITYRILLSEANARNLDLIEYLTKIVENVAIFPEIYEFSANLEQDDELFYTD